VAQHPGRDDRPADELMSGLRRVFDAVDPVPAHVREAAVAAFGWRTLDDELASLSYDSLLDSGLAAAVRSSAATARMVSFEASGRCVELELTTEALVGQLLPAGAASVDVRTRDGVATVATDDLGRFELRPPPVGPVSLRIRTAGDATLVTEWILV